MGSKYDYTVGKRPRQTYTGSEKFKDDVSEYFRNNRKEYPGYFLTAWKNKKRKEKRLA